jgi:deoxyribonuclease-4
MAATARRAAGLDLQAVQIFTANQRRWRSPPIPPEQVQAFRGKMEVPVLSHASYLINPAGSREGVTARSRRALVDELRRMEQLGIGWMVLHPGSHLGDGPARGVERAADMIGTALEGSPHGGVLLENTAGMGSSLGADLTELAAISRLVDAPERVGFCIDTAHLHGAGYDLRPEGLRATVARIEQELQGGPVRAFHLNDSRAERGSRRDRHQSVGKGNIGLQALGMLAAMEGFEGVPAVVETPGTDADRLRDARLIEGRAEDLRRAGH